MRILVTGATTPLGGEVGRRLLTDPAVEHVLEAGAEPFLGDAPRLSYRRCDLTRERAVHDLVHGDARAHGVDTVIHLALRQLLAACAAVPTIARFVYPSSAAVYALRASGPALLDEDAALEFDPEAPQWIRDRVEADLTVCARMGMSRLAIVVLRTAEILAPDMGSQLWDYLRSRVCLRPLGFDPMINVISLEDAAAAVVLAAGARGQGVYNVAGADTLPLSRLIARWGRRDVPVPRPLLAPLYRLRAGATGLEFRFDLNLRRFQFGGLIDDARARADLGYRPTHPLRWPRP